VGPRSGLAFRRRVASPQQYQNQGSASAMSIQTSLSQLQDIIKQQTKDKLSRK